MQRRGHVILVIVWSLLSTAHSYGGGGNQVSGSSSHASANYQQQQPQHQQQQPSHGHQHHHNRPSNSQSDGGAQQGRINEVFGWNQINFAYPNAQARQEAIRSGTFNASTVIPIGVAAAGSRVFITMPKWRAAGTPAAIATIPFPSDSTAPLLQPYPSWSWHRPRDCDGITSVFRVKVDECGRLWVLDTGVVNTFVQAQRICQPQVLVFDLNNDQLLYRYRFPNTVLKTDSLLCSIEVEYPDGRCGGSAGVTGAMLYVADPTTFGIIVVNLQQQGPAGAWRVQDKTMYPSPEAGTYTVNGESFEFMDGVLALALSPRSNQLERTLYYYPMSSYRQSWVRTSDLRNSTTASSNPRAFQTSVQTRVSQAAGCSMDENGVLFFGLVTSNALACWNSRKPFTTQNIGILAQNDRTMQFPSTATVDPAGRLWALSMRFQSVLSGSLNPQDVNYRVFMAPSSAAAVRGTSCERGGQSQGNNGGTGQLVFRP